jgi:hypothetical protein
MRKINFFALVLFIIGLIISILGWVGFPDGLSGGYLTLFVGYPLILISLVLSIISFFIKN